MGGEDELRAGFVPKQRQFEEQGANEQSAGFVVFTGEAVATGQKLLMEGDPLVRDGLCGGVEVPDRFRVADGINSILVIGQKAPN